MFKFRSALGRNGEKAISNDPVTNLSDLTLGLVDTLLKLRWGCQPRPGSLDYNRISLRNMSLELKVSSHLCWDDVNGECA